MREPNREEGPRVILTGIPFAQLPHAALSLSDTAYQVLGAIVRQAGTATSVEVTDQELGQAICRSEPPTSRGRPRRRPWRPGKSVGSVQRALVELEEVGLIERRRRYGRRRLILLYTLAGRESRPQPRTPAKTINALSAGAKCNEPPSSMHSAPVSNPTSSNKGNNPNTPDCVESLPQEETPNPNAGALLRAMIADLGAGFSIETREIPSQRKKLAAGISPKTPRPPAKETFHVAQDCTEESPPSSRSEHPTQHNAH